MKAYVIVSEHLVDQPGHDMLSRMLLHPLKAHLPQDPPFHFFSFRNRFFRVMPDHSVPFMDVGDFHLIQISRIRILTAAFREEYPHVTFNILRQDSELVVESISKGMADIGFCGTDTHNPDCVFESFIQDHLVIITPNTERFRQMRTTGIKADFLKTEPIILREEGSGTRKETEHFLAKAGIDIGELKIAAQFNDPDSIKHAVSQGMGISIISKAAVEDYENFGLLLSFDLSGISMDRHLYIVSHKNNPLSFIGEVFLNFVKMYYDK